MKTTAQKLVVIATVAIFGLTVQAQNTKAVKLSHYKGQLAELVSVKMNTAVNELSSQLENLKAAVKYTPAELNEDLYPVEASFDYTSIENELEKELKYNPSEVVISAYEYEENVDVLENVQVELEEVVKFRPAEATTYDENPDLAEIMTELEKEVKYVPSAF